MVVYPSFLRRLDSVASWKLYRYTLPLITFGDLRHGLILHMIHSDGKEGWGEIAPLPGRSKETLEEATTQLLKTLALTGSPSPLLLPSVSFGLESALTPYQPPTTPFPLWALLAGTPDAMKEKAKRAEQEGFSSLKIKVSHLNDKQAYSLISSLIGTFRLRIDVNQAWEYDRTLRFFSQFPSSAIECIEEPTHELDRLADFPFPFALDESLPEIPLSQLTRLTHLTTLIIKPTVAGGSAAWHFLKQLGKKMIFTGAFESGIGTVQIANLVHQFNFNNTPLGLDTYRFLQEDLLTTPLDFSHGMLHLPSKIEINYNYLTEIAHG